MFQRSKKRGMSPIFNWIFVIVAGAIILTFFIRFAFMHAETSEKVMNVRYVDTLKNIITNFAISLTGDRTISLPTKIYTYFDCNGILMMSDNKDYRGEIPRKVVFAPFEFNDKEMILWTVPWQYPFTITNFVYVSSPKIKYYLIYDRNINNYIQEFKSKIPERFSLEIINKIDSNEIKRENKAKSYYHNRFIFFNQPSINTLNDIFNLEIPASVAYIDTINNKINFYKNNSIETININDDLLRYGAIFSDDFDIYNCEIKKAMSELKTVTQIYSEKARLLAIKDTKGCYYNEVKANLDNLAMLSQTLNIEEMYSIKELLIEQNNLLDNQNCPVIF